MNDLFIKATKTLPEVIFTKNGELKISGRMINDLLINFYCPLIAWVEQTKCKQIYFDINLEYINTSGTILLVKLLKAIEANSSIKQIEINWQFDEIDEEHYDLGCYIKQCLKRSKMKFQSNQTLECFHGENFLLELK